MKVFTLILSTLLFVLTSPMHAQEADFERVAEQTIPAVVSITVKTTASSTSSKLEEYGLTIDEDFLGRLFGIPKSPSLKAPQISQASGFIVSPDGYILTNNHVVKEGQDIQVLLQDGRDFKGKVIGTDESTDLALIKIEGTNLPYLKFGDSDALRIGQWVVAIGSPFGLQASLTVGVVSAKGRSNLDIARVEDFIQTDAALNAGNSGGPLLNLKSEVIGINTAIATQIGNNGYIGIGFAIPSNMAQHVLQQLKETGSVSRSYLGVIIQPIDSSLAKAFGLQKIEGALVSDVLKDSPADKAKIQQGDVIVRLNNQPVESVGQLRNFIALQKPGTKINLSIIRDKKPLEISLEVAQIKDEKKEGSQISAFGLKVETFTKEVAANLRRDHEEGVLVTQVESGSPADFVGIKKGALILSVNKEKVATKEQFEEAIKKTAQNQPVLFLIKQKEQTRYVSIEIIR